MDSKKKAEGVKVETTTAAEFKVGEMVVHTDDPTVKGKVLKIDGARVQVEGYANKLPADKLRAV